MKVLTAAEMREVDRRTIELGIPGLILMENAGHRVVEFLAERFGPLAQHRIVVFCGKGNNGGDGMVVARQLFTRWRPRALWVLLSGPEEELSGEAAVNWKALRACGCPVARAITPAMREATLVIDALLGTGISGAPRGRAAEWIEEINTGFPQAQVVAVDVPSGVGSDEAESPGPAVRASYTVTFTAPKVAHALPPNCRRSGKLVVAQIGSPAGLMDGVRMHLVEPGHFKRLLAPRNSGGHKGDYGHVLVWAGGRGKTGAAAMAGISALRAGAGLVTVASASKALASISGHAAELMTAAVEDYGALESAARGKDVLAIGPGLGTAPETVGMVHRAVEEMAAPMVVDADGLNALAGRAFRRNGAVRVFTPHPGEMARLTGLAATRVNAYRVGVAQAYAREREVVLVLKGERTVIAMPGGEVWINPTGTPAMATGGSGDILTGMIAGLLAQFPEQADAAVLAGVYLHGLAGELAAAKLGEKCVIATDLLAFLGEAMHACANAPDAV